MYLVQDTESKLQFAAPFDQYEVMYNEGAPEYIIDHGLYYPNGAGYGYICAGFESTSDWEDHQNRIFGLDGQNVQYTGVANENLPYVYYTSGYGFGQSPYNPYNPYIPGAMIGVDGSVVTAQQCYALPLYENSISSPSHVPVILQSGPGTVASGIADSFIDNAKSVNGVDTLVAKHNLHSDTRNSSLTAVGATSSLRTRVSEGGRTNNGYGKLPVPNITSDNFTSRASLRVPQVRGSQGTENGWHRKASSDSNQLKSSCVMENGSSGFESVNQTSIHKVKTKLSYGSKSRNQLVVKAYTSRAGNPDPQGNINIIMDQYNKVDFCVDYVNAKFFVIKSYSEDDVHKSIKYNVWSSTPNGNKKLNAAYEDAQKISAVYSGGCPIFLFFSVNASGQFCGVAEMTGPVDFHRDMDFWQQDKWSASFPVKWHIVKDLPNHNFRHIILENNENKPVTNSRDTQEIFCKKGLEMLQIFKNYASKTSLFDDFLYYENREKIIHDERSRYFVPVLDPPRKLRAVGDFPCVEGVDDKKPVANSVIALKKAKVPADCGEEKHSSMPTGKTSFDTNTNSTSADGRYQVPVDGVPDAVNQIKMSSLTIHSDEQETELPLPNMTKIGTGTGTVDVVTIGSMPVKVTGSETSGFLTVGTIPLDPRALRRE